MGEKSDQNSEYYPGSHGKSGKGAESVYSRQLKVLAGGPEPLHKRLVVTLDEQNQSRTIPLPAGTIGFGQNRRYTSGNVD